jgi:PAS domain S-box-containing protein
VAQRVVLLLPIATGRSTLDAGPLRRVENRRRHDQPGLEVDEATMGSKMLKQPKRLVGIIAEMKWDVVALLLFVPLVAASINRYFGAEPFLRKLGSLGEPLIEMVFLAGIGVFMSVRGAERLRTIERLQAAEARYRGMVEDQTELICRFLADWTLTFVNDAYCRYFGKSKDDLVGRSFMSLVPSEERKQVEVGLASLNLDTLIMTMEHQVVVNGELRWQHWTNRAIFDADGRVSEFQAVGRDITERKWAETERERLIGVLKEKNEDLEMMNYSISHDLKSPLITVIGLLAWVERDALSGNLERMKSNLQVVLNAAARMEQLIDQLTQFLLLGRPNANMEDLDFASLAHDAAGLLSGRIAQTGVDLQIATNFPPVRGNRSLLLQTLQNLIENSIKYMGDQSQPEVKIEARSDASGPVFCVSDNGVGIDPSCREKVFSLFNRLDNRGIEGSGLGLALVKRAVEAQGGRIWVESEGYGRGSTFCFSLPDSRAGGNQARSS